MVRTVFYILEVPCSNLGPYHDRFVMIFINPHRQMTGQYLKLHHDRFFLCHFQFIVHQRHQGCSRERAIYGSAPVLFSLAGRRPDFYFKDSGVTYRQSGVREWVIVSTHLEYSVEGIPF